jgi:hypothetical protein
MNIDCPNAETCDGVLTFRVYRDSDGDPSIPYGTRTWTDAEYMGSTCSCDFDPKTWDQLTIEAIEASETDRYRS